MAKSRVQPGERHERIESTVLTAGVELLSESGVRGITVEGVARRSGIAKTTIYRHWPQKEQLIIAVIAEVATTLPTPSTGDVGTDFRIVLSALSEDLSKPAQRSVVAGMIEASACNHSLADLHLSFLANTQEPLVRVFMQGVHSGQLSEDLDIRLTLGLLTGPVVTQALFYGARVDDTFLDQLIEHVIGPIRSRTG